ncbi:ABC transporter ATP-binding protein [Agromyces atrinae]|uniref:ABC transporter ATP-binding protein n=1 Tax=Agromyces atrinae TaxID=592376 RepID=A0A4Q2MDV2_9MICO|nr:ABC transporter ATP-binding protein [Agromyces atrinae]NYD67454.1 peptide/nickel transport system ATP-binding protein [Agromyces atrinae]RXZ88321.1 ABC transporter ATP-binding protein [Agromyces atrinae]
MTSTPLLSVRELRVTFDTGSGPVEAVKGVSFDVAAGETVAIVGESGSGKSTIASSINRLLAANGRISGGEIEFDGRDLVRATERQMIELRGSVIGFVPQDPMSNLNPVHRVGRQIQEALEVHGRARGADAHKQVIELLELVGIPEPERRFEQYPHEFSGGMRQRALIAMGLACRPALLIADEPTSALDVTVQRRILDQLDTLTAELGTAVVLITHDLALAAERADRVVVMFRGDIVEQGPAQQLLSAPQHEYTKQLLAAAPSLTTATITERIEPGTGEGPAELARLEGLGKKYRMRGGDDFWAARDVSFSIPRGRTVAVVGESGSGKSTTAKLMLGLETPSEGRVVMQGKDVATLKGRELLAFRRTVQPVFQNPFASLDPRYTVEESIVEPLRVHRVGSRDDRRRRMFDLLDRVALPAELADRLPHELSGGQRQRVAIARALALSPDLVVLDEAVSALDVLVQAQILDLLAELQRELGLSYLFISHDLAVVKMISHVVHVMRAGRIVESGTPAEIFDAPRDEYTRELLAAIPGAGLAV